MIAASSRYAGCQILFYTTPEGQEIPYLSRRFLPQGNSLQVLVEVTVAQGDRLDQLATRTLGDPEQNWRISDANNAMNPETLVEAPGRQLRVPVPYPQASEVGTYAGSDLQFTSAEGVQFLGGSAW